MARFYLQNKKQKIRAHLLTLDFRSVFNNVPDALIIHRICALFFLNDWFVGCQVSYISKKPPP